MKIFIKLKDFQHTAEVDNISINCINGDIVINDDTERANVMSEEYARKLPDRFYKPVDNPLYDPKVFAKLVKLIEAGYSMEKIGEYTGIPAWKVRRINRGIDASCRGYIKNDMYKFPIREMPKIGSRKLGDNIPVTLCKECNEPIHAEELITNLRRCYCEKCEKKIMSESKNDEPIAAVDNVSINCAHDDIVISDATDTDSSIASKKKPKKAWTAKYENPKLASEAIKLLKLGYSITQVAKSLDIHYMVISRINNGEQHYREDFPNEKFPIQDNKSCKGMYSSNVWRRVPVTYCKECGEPIPVADLLKDPHCEYCPDCKAKHKEE